MTTARQIMHTGAAWIPKGEMVDHAARLMRELNVSALPVADEHRRLCGILTERGIVVDCVALGRDPSRTTAGELVQGTLRWVDAEAGVDEVLVEMEEHRIRRLPVVENNRLIGMISEADLAQHLSDEQLATWVHGIHADHPA